MLPAEEIVTAAIRAGIAAFAADEAALRSVYDGYPTARLDALVAAMADADKRPQVATEYDREQIRTPYVLVQTGDERAEVTPGGLGDDVADSETIEVVVYDTNPARVGETARLVRACLLVARKAHILARAGCLGIAYRGASDIGPAPVPIGKDMEPGLAPENLLAKVLTYQVLSEFSPSVPTGLEGVDLIEDVAVLRAGFTDISYEPPVDGGVSFSRPT